MGKPWRVAEWSCKEGWHVTEIVPVTPKDLPCPSCRSTNRRSIEACRVTCAKRRWWTFWRHVERTPPCPACGRTDSHYHLTCDDCGRVWDIGERSLFDGSPMFERFGKGAGT